MTDRQRIVILGAGFAGLETAFLLRMRMRDRAELTVVSEREAFSFRPDRKSTRLNSSHYTLSRMPSSA